MKKICSFSEAPLIVIQGEAGQTIVDETLKFRKIAHPYQQIPCHGIVQIADDNYYMVEDGFVRCPAASFLRKEYFQERTPLEQPKAVRIKVSHGTDSYDIHGKKLQHFPLKATALVIEKGVSLWGEEWFRTLEEEWLPAAALYFKGESFLFQEKNSECLSLLVVSPEGTEILTQNFTTKNRLPQGAEASILGKYLDVFGDFWWQIAEDAFVRTDYCIALPEKIKNSLANYWYLPANVINQDFWGIPNGCEAASLLQGFQYQGLLLETDYQSWIDQMPISPEYDPYEGFGGSPYKIAKGRFEAIFPPALLKWGRRYGRLRDLSGADEQALGEALRRGNPVVTYVTIDFTEPEPDTYPWGATFANNHAVLLDGETDDLWHVSDPIAGSYWLEKERFARSYDPRRWAIEVLP